MIRRILINLAALAMTGAGVVLCAEPTPVQTLTRVEIIQKLQAEVTVAPMSKLAGMSQQDQAATVQKLRNLIADHAEEELPAVVEGSGVFLKSRLPSPIAITHADEKYLETYAEVAVRSAAVFAKALQSRPVLTDEQAVRISRVIEGLYTNATAIMRRELSLGAPGFSETQIHTIMQGSRERLMRALQNPYNPRLKQCPSETEVRVLLADFDTRVKSSSGTIIERIANPKLSSVPPDDRPLFELHACREIARWLEAQICKSTSSPAWEAFEKEPALAEIRALNNTLAEMENKQR